MIKPLSLDLRQRVIAAIEAGLSCRAAAARFGIAPSAAVKWRRLWRETGAVAPRVQGGDTRSGRIEALGPAILAMVEETPDITLAAIAARLQREPGERFAPSTVHRCFRRRGWSFKKTPPMPASRTAPMSPRRARPSGPCIARSPPLDVIVRASPERSARVRGPAGPGPGAADRHRW